MTGTSLLALPCVGVRDAEREGNQRPPTGDVTFVLTDIVGSTQMFRALGRTGYIDALDRHREALRAGWCRYDGHELSAEGDGFLVAFRSPAPALLACLFAQQELMTGAGPLVRMAIHRGPAEPRESGEYVTLTIHEVARIIAVSDGRHVVITSDVMRALPEPLALAGELMGTSWPRDFDRPVDLFAFSARHA